MKERIQEALRRRHRKEDEGFTLIELLVVILIIAILAAVGIVALLSALSSGKKSAAKTTLRTAITAVKSIQTGDGAEDYSTVTIAALTAAEPDLKFDDQALPTDGTANHVAGLESGFTADQIQLVTRDADNHCFFVELNRAGATRYGHDSTCGGTTVWATNQKDGWKA